ncbi:hypothetical protein [Glutamicibacter mishrai]|uniref:Uncharacterized protein n=1 Tax=Glutamicibacter mishrai TaxID=1775880 RepID=A0A6H0SPP2_9MICC|nr:hypothetical protein [Glutamicibacter mishrai]QIV88305.1 hypothetical protein D3791_15035 [Glutamicibacter mishrai]
MEQSAAAAPSARFFAAGVGDGLGEGVGDVSKADSVAEADCLVEVVLVGSGEAVFPGLLLEAEGSLGTLETNVAFGDSTGTAENVAVGALLTSGSASRSGSSVLELSTADAEADSTWMDRGVLFSEISLDTLGVAGMLGSVAALSDAVGSLGADDAVMEVAADIANASVATERALHCRERRGFCINCSRRHLRRRAILSPTGLPNTRFPQILVWKLYRSILVNAFKRDALPESSSIMNIRYYLPFNPQDRTAGPKFLLN